MAGSGGVVGREPGNAVVGTVAVATLVFSIPWHLAGLLPDFYLMMSISSERKR